MEEKVKKTFEEPKVEKVEFDFKTRIALSNDCGGASMYCKQDGQCDVVMV